MINIDTWIRGYKVMAFNWIDKETIYFNLQYYKSGQSIEQPPVWDKTVYITDNTAGQRLIRDFLDSLVEYVASMQINSGNKVVITA
jgi:hypothetical protein